MSGLHSTSIHWIITFGGNVGVLSQDQPMLKIVTEFEDALQLIWTDLVEIGINNAMKDVHSTSK